MNKQQKKIFENYKNLLGISHPGEVYVLEHILKRDWDREIILIDITCISVHCGTIWVECSTASATYSFSVPILGGEGWATQNENKQKAIISSNLYHKLRR